VDERSLAQEKRTVRVDQDHESSGDPRRNCFYCLEGWLFLGFINHDGEEIREAFHCRRCKGTGWISY
jgi:hypothetical protein